jgi:aminoglycoside phosphotransferase (APT) family kinase protein
MPRTLVHNDFNPRNIALRRDGRLVAYDWELATVGVPQRDLAELLAFVLPASVDPAAVEHHLEVHRAALAAASGREIDPHDWRRGYELALRDVLTTRLQLYLMAHTQREYPFLDRVVATTRRLWELESARVDTTPVPG